MQQQLIDIEAELVKAAVRVCKRFDQQYEELKQNSPSEAELFYLNLVPSNTIFAGGRKEPVAMKYVRRARAHVHKWVAFLPYLSGLEKVYEIGVGPGYLFRMMMDYYSTDISGCDLDPEKNLIFAKVREELGIADRIQNHKVIAKQDIPIPDGTDGLFAFWTVFNFNWSVDDHAWFIEHCREKLAGEKRVVLLFNDRGYDDRPEIQDFYRKRARFPFLESDIAPEFHPRDKNAFCILNLG
jgi:hypothetical protein